MLSVKTASRPERLFFYSVFTILMFTGLSGRGSAQNVPSSGRTCSGSFSGAFNGNITIFAGQVCRFTGGGIAGNVVLSGGTLSLDKAAVRGNVLLTGGGTLILTNTTIGGNVEISGGGVFAVGPSAVINGNFHVHDIPAGPRQNRICGSKITGNLQFQNNGTAVEIGAASACAGNAIGGNLEVKNNAAATTVFNNSVGGNGMDQTNTAATLVIGNTVGGNLLVQNNTAPVTVAFNNVERNLQCENDPTISGGSNITSRNQGCPNSQQVSAFATSNGSSIVFKSPTGISLLTIPLLNQEVVTQTPQGDVTNVTQERANISDDGSHAGLYTESFAVHPGEEGTEPHVTSTFAYYDATGFLWQISAPSGDAFYLPASASVRSVTPDGSRLLIASTEDGNINPSFTVYDQTGQALYQLAEPFRGLYEAQISPNGRYLLIIGVVESNQTRQDLIRVVDLTTKLSSDLPITIATAGTPAVSISGDGRFLISYQGTQSVLPQ